MGDDGEPLVNFPDASGKTRFTILSVPDGSFRVKTPDGSLRQFPPGMSWQEIGEQFSNALDAAQPDVGTDMLKAAQSAAVTGPMSTLSIPGDIEGWMKSGGIQNAFAGQPLPPHEGGPNADPRAAAINQGSYTKVMPGGAQTAVDPAAAYPPQQQMPDVSSPLAPFNGKIFPSFDDLMAIYNGQNVPNTQGHMVKGPDGSWQWEKLPPRAPFVPYEPKTALGRGTNWIVGTAAGAGPIGLMAGPRMLAAGARGAGSSAAELGAAGAIRQAGSTALWQGAVPGAAMWAADEATMNSDPRIRAGVDTVAGLAAGMYPQHWLTPHPTRSDIPVQPGRSGTAVNPTIDPVFSPAVPKSTTDAQILRDAGVDLTAGQRTGYQALAFRESEGGGQAFQDAIDRQRQQFTQETLRRANIHDADGNVPTRLTPETLSASMARTGNEIGRLATNTDIELRIPDVQRVWTALNEYIDSTSPAMRVPSVNKRVDDVVRPVLEAIFGQNQSFAVYSGEKYRNVRSELGRMAESMKNSNPTAANALREVQNVLDDAMERTLAASGSADLGAWRDARRQYQSQLIVQSAADRGQAGAAGYILPSALQAAVKDVQGKSAYSKGFSQFDDLARAGSDLMTIPSNSGTSARQKISNLAYNLAPVALAGGLAGYGANPTGAPDTYAAGGGALAAAAAALIAPRIFNRTIMSRPVQGYLANQAFAPSPSGTGVANRMALLHSITMPQRFPLPVQAPSQAP